MYRAWKKLEEWLRVRNPPVFSDLNGPADAAAIQGLISSCPGPLPEDFVECFKVHDGQRGSAEGVFDGYTFLSIRRLRMSWSTWNDLLEGGDFDGRDAYADGAVRPVWWSRGWIPFASNGGGDYLCIDLEPPTHGVRGQVIRVFHDAPERIVIAPGFGQWFDHFVDAKI